MPTSTALRRNPAFVLLWVSQTISALGTSVSSLAYPLLVLELTGSALRAGLVAATLAGTAMVLRIPAGVVADRYRSTTVMLAADAARIVAVASVAVGAWIGWLSLPQILAVAAVEAAAGVVFGPADFAAVRAVLARRQRVAAVAAMQARGQLAGLVGPLAGGALFALHPALPFGVDALSYAVSFGCVLLLRRGRGGLLGRGPGGLLGRDAGGLLRRHAGGGPQGSGAGQRPARCGPGAGPSGRRLRDEALAGLRWLRGEPFLWPAVWWTAALTGTFAGVGLILVVLARARGAAPGDIGVMYALSASGGLAGAWAAPALLRRVSGRAILVSAALLDAVAAVALLWQRSPYVIGALGAVAFLLAPAVSAVIFGQVSQRSPDGMVARAQSAATLIVAAPAPLAPVLVGAVVDTRGPEASILVCAAIFGGLALAAALLPAPPPDTRAA